MISAVRVYMSRPSTNIDRVGVAVQVWINTNRTSLVSSYDWSVWGLGLMTVCDWRMLEWASWCWLVYILKLVSIGNPRIISKYSKFVSFTKRFFWSDLMSNNQYNSVWKYDHEILSMKWGGIKWKLQLVLGVIGLCTNFPECLSSFPMMPCERRQGL